MLAARKEVLHASLGRQSVDLRSKELAFYVEVLNNLVMQSSILVGFAYVAMVEMEITDEIQERLLRHSAVWVVGWYFLSCCATMATAIYILAIASGCIIYAHRLALQGPAGSVERAVAVVMKSRHPLIAAYVTSMASMVSATCSMAVMKIPELDGHNFVPEMCVATFCLMAVVITVHFRKLAYEFRIDPEAIVSGEVLLREPASVRGSPRAFNGTIDLTRIEPAPPPATAFNMRRTASATGPLHCLAEPLLGASGQQVRSNRTSRRPSGT